jgi:hypothetical protein
VVGALTVKEISSLTWSRASGKDTKSDGSERDEHTAL